MFDVGWSEMLVIGVVALVVIGPKDLPDMFRTVGRFTSKARSMAGEFQRAMEQAANEAGVKDVAKDLRGITSTRSLGLDTVKDAAARFEKWDPMKPAAKPAVATPDPNAPAPSPVAPRGPATQALADKVAAESTARLQAAQAAMSVASGTRITAPPPPTAEEAAEVARPAVKRARKPPADPLAVAVAATKKPRAKKGDA